MWSGCKAIPLVNSGSPSWKFTTQCFLPWPLSTKHEDFISQPTMISLAISLILVSEPSANSSVVFRPSRDVPSLLQTDWALWSKALLKAMGLSSSAVYKRSWEIYFPNNCGVLNSNCFTLAVGKEYTEIVTVNQMICRSLEHSILYEPYNLPPWRHVAFVLYLLQDKPIVHVSVGSFSPPYPQLENLRSKESGSFVDCSLRVDFLIPTFYLDLYGSD